MRIVLKVRSRRLGRRAEPREEAEPPRSEPEQPVVEATDQDPEEPTDPNESGETRWIPGTGWTDDPR